MAEPRRFLDVWIVETNTVYREVPYTVVSDWVQQGRLLESDMLRPSGTSQWSRLGTMPAFAAYLPKAEPLRSDDRAEALEPVELDVAWKQPREEEEGDPDMIPLIDVSLVLLVFFMMTATVIGSAAGIMIPEARNGTSLANLELWLGVRPGREGQPVYMLGEGTQSARPEDRDLTEAEVLEHLKQRLAGGQVADVTVQADQSLPYDVIKKLSIQLEGLRAQGKIRHTYAGVNQRTSS